jgi:cytochrome P450
MAQDLEVGMSKAIGLDRERIRQLFDLRKTGDAVVNGEVFSYTDDPYPSLHRLRQTGPVHRGIVHELLGFDKPAMFQALPEPDRPHFSVFNYELCDRAYRDEETFPSAPEPVDPAAGGLESSVLYMNGPMHRRYRALAQPSFVPKKAEWWISKWIHETVHSLIDNIEPDGHAELNVDFDAAIPILTITGSFGFSVDQALDVRQAVSGGFAAEAQKLAQYLMPVIEARRNNPQDDLISVLCQAEITDEDGVRHQLSDTEIFSFSHILLIAGSGTTWKQLGITLSALLTRPEVLAVIREDRSLLPAAIDESLRWNVTDPMFSRYVAKNVELGGITIPKGGVVHLSNGAGNHDPSRWENPDEFDIYRPQRPHLAFGSGPHLCIGQHVARAELHVAVDALLTRLPNLRLDPEKEPPRMIGMYHRGVTEINAVWD